MWLVSWFIRRPRHHCASLSLLQCNRYPPRTRLLEPSSRIAACTHKCSQRQQHSPTPAPVLEQIVLFSSLQAGRFSFTSVSSLHSAEPLGGTTTKRAGKDGGSSQTQQQRQAGAPRRGRSRKGRQSSSALCSGSFMVDSVIDLCPQSSLVLRFVNNDFQENKEPTIGGKPSLPGAPASAPTPIHPLRPTVELSLG